MVGQSTSAGGIRVSTVITLLLDSHCCSGLKHNVVNSGNYDFLFLCDGKKKPISLQFLSELFKSRGRSRWLISLCTGEMVSEYQRTGHGNTIQMMYSTGVKHKGQGPYLAYQRFQSGPLEEFVKCKNDNNILIILVEVLHLDQCPLLK